MIQDEMHLKCKNWWHVLQTTLSPLSILRKMAQPTKPDIAHEVMMLENENFRVAHWTCSVSKPNIPMVVLAFFREGVRNLCPSFGLNRTI